MDDDATDEALSAADTAAQEAEDQLAEAKEIEASSRRWVSAIVPILAVYDQDLTMVDADVRDEIGMTVKAACRRLRRLLKSDLGGGR